MADELAIGIEAKGPHWSLTVKGINSPKLLGNPFGTGLQMYAGMREPLVNANVGRTAASASNE